MKRRLQSLRWLAPSVAALLGMFPGMGSAAQLSATPSSLSGVFSSAQAGDTIVLGAGDYGSFTGAMKSGEVTLTGGRDALIRLDFNPASNITVDGVTLTSADIGDARTKNITVRNADVPGQVMFRTSQLANANILFDRNVHHDWDACPSCGEGRIWLPGDTPQPSGITISNSEFRGGQSDGIQNGSNGTRIIANEFHDLELGSENGVHTDAIQLYGSSNTLIKSNYIHDVNGAPIMAPDGADHEIIEDNVISEPDVTGYPFALTLYSDDGSIVRHNTFTDGACSFNLRCGIMRIGAKDSCSYAAECDPGRGTIIKDNILAEMSYGGGPAKLLENVGNLFGFRLSGVQSLKGIPLYRGGTRPTTYSGFALAPGSRGKGDASDGLDRGIRVESSAPPIGSGGDRAGEAAGRVADSVSASASVRVLSSLRSIRKTGRLRLRVRTTVAGNIVVAGSVRPGNALRRYRRGHSRAVIVLKSVALDQPAAGASTVTLRLSPSARRTLGRSRSARLKLTITVNGQATTTKVPLKR